MRKRKEPVYTYDRTRKEPALRCSICTGEQTAGFRDLETNRFEEVMLVRNEGDLQEFCRQYGVEGPVRKIY